MTWQDHVAVTLGVVCIGIGLAYFFSPRFAQVAFAYSSQGVFWKGIVGGEEAEKGKAAGAGQGQGQGEA